MHIKRPSSRMLATLVALAAVAGAVWLLEPVLMHTAAQAIVASQKKALPEIGVGKPAPDFTLRNANGDRVHLSDYRGKVVVLNFWTTWCGPCKVEIPWFVEFQNEFGPQGFTVLGVSMDDDGWKVVRPFIAEQKMNYPVVLGDDNVSELYGGIEGLPTTLVIGRDGRIGYLHSGLIAKQDYRTEIAEMLKKGA